LGGKAVDVEAARKAVARGAFQFALIVPKGTSETFIDKAKTAAKNSIDVGRDSTNEKLSGPRPSSVPGLLVYFDPTLQENVRMGIVSSLEKALLSIETDEKVKAFAALLPKEIEAAAKKAMGNMWSEDFKKNLPSVRIDWDKSPIMAIEEKTARYGNITKRPNTVQQNIPAWTIFGMFFVVVPLAGSLLRERQGEMLVRLLTMPQSVLTILGGKIVSYLIICLIQFLLIMVVGKLVLPLLGAPVLDLGSSPIALVLIAVSSALSACGYGIFLGTTARTYEQASTFGAVSVVIAAAIGGIMVPVFVMPPLMQKISILSPLAWGLNAYLDVFVREGTTATIIPDVCLLLIFFLVTSAAAWFNLSRKGRIRIQ
jgi:ABC-2 type transport system permease protein